jgi:hypothetical protein
MVSLQQPMPPPTMDRERSENVTNNGQPEPAGGKQASNALQPDNSSRHATTPNAKVKATIQASPLVKRRPCLFSHGSGHWGGSAAR